MAIYDKPPYVGGERGDAAWFNRHPGEYSFIGIFPKAAQGHFSIHINATNIAILFLVDAHFFEYNTDVQEVIALREMGAAHEMHAWGKHKSPERRCSESRRGAVRLDYAR